MKIYFTVTENFNLYNLLKVIYNLNNYLII